MTLLPDDRPLAFITSAALTAYDVVSIAVWTLLLWMVARGSKRSFPRDLFTVILTVAAIHTS